METADQDAEPPVKGQKYVVSSSPVCLYVALWRVCPADPCYPEFRKEPVVTMTDQLYKGWSA